MMMNGRSGASSQRATSTAVVMSTVSPKATTTKELKIDQSVEIPIKFYDPNSEISYDINSARNTLPVCPNFQCVLHRF